MKFWGYQNFSICKSGPNYLKNRRNKRKMSMEKTSERAHILLMLWQVRGISCLFSAGAECRFLTLWSLMSGGFHRWIFQIPFLYGNNRDNNECSSCTNTYLTCDHLSLGFHFTLLLVYEPLLINGLSINCVKIFAF